jgi:Meckel syndrome type 1 protein
MPIAALTLTADETAAALPTSAASPIKPLAAVSTKVLAKADAATAPASAQPESTAPADQPATAGAVPATSPVVAEAANRDAKAASDTPGQAPETQSASNGGDNASLSGLPAAPVAPQAALQTPANLAAANGAAIVSQIATQVTKSVDGKSTRFDISLDPAGLGHVNVKVEIGAQGQITAQLSFDNAHTAAEAKSQAGQLQQALEQAGFNIAQGGLSFDVGGQGGGFAGQDASAQQPLATSVQTSDLSTTPQSAAVAVASSRPASGVDITI